MSRTRTDCEGFHRRDVLRVGVAGLLGMSLPDALRAEALNPPDAPGPVSYTHLTLPTTERV